MKRFKINRFRKRIAVLVKIIIMKVIQNRTYLLIEIKMFHLDISNVHLS